MNQAVVTNTPLVVFAVSIAPAKFRRSLSPTVVPRRISWVYPGFPTLFLGISVFFMSDLMGKALWKLVENAARFPRARWARSVRPRRRQLPQGPSVWAKMAPGSFHRLAKLILPCTY